MAEQNLIWPRFSGTEIAPVLEVLKASAPGFPELHFRRDTTHGVFYENCISWNYAVQKPWRCSECQYTTRAYVMWQGKDMEFRIRQAWVSVIFCYWLVICLTLDKSHLTFMSFSFLTYKVKMVKSILLDQLFCTVVDFYSCSFKIDFWAPTKS